MTLTTRCSFGFMFAMLSLAPLSTSCADDIEFEKEIAPILEEHCWHCHGEDEQESGLRLDLRAKMLRGGDSGLAALVPGDADKSYLIEVVKHLDPDFKMPPDEEKIPASQIRQLEDWINQGANWPGQMQDVVEEKSDHWSFQPVARPNVPKIKPEPNTASTSQGDDGNASYANPIDAFLLQSLQSHNLSFSDRADPRSLLRRASIVLTGLTPSPKETNAFLKAHETNPENAYADLVDRLLDSRHFGERWAQHWLDVIRWAETNGSESNMYRKNAWMYRDYVTEAFNNDKPYDEFLFEQIAGDTVGQGIAMGYLVSGPHVPVATVGQQPEARRQARADRMDEILQTVGASALGMTIGCARCHNHKFDPISIRDYYSMAAVFEDIEFGSRLPELTEDHPFRIRGNELETEMDELRRELKTIGPWEEHWTAYRDIHFAKAKTDSVRVTFLGKSVYIDELEIFAIDSTNVALASSGTKTTSPPALAVDRKELHKINDGQYGTEQWAAKTPDVNKEKPWVQFDFTEPVEIDRIRISSNREDFYETDYLEKLNTGHVTPYRIEVRDNAGEWKQVAATPQYKQLDKKNESRAGIMAKLQRLVEKAIVEGPKPSFVARFIPPAKTHVLSRGSPENPRDEVVPTGLSELDGDLGLDGNATGKERRTAFANWITDPIHPLTARVAANRIWHHVFGQGIVPTTGDFGAAGAPPTHPELLDWLAAEFIQPSTTPLGTPKTPSTTQPWSMKHLVRLMVMSDAFRQSSLPNASGINVDASSAMLWRFPPKRVEAEVIRDSILRASGLLDQTIGGKSYRIHNVKKRYAQWEIIDNHGPHTWRRMLYQERMRRVDDQMFTAFDFPDCGQVRAKRPVSTTPLQALNLMNSKFVLEQSQKIAERALTDTNANAVRSIDRCFELILGRNPTNEEREACRSLAQQEDLSLVCRALVNSNEFAFIP